jgi:hypothetical protein
VARSTTVCYRIRLCVDKANEREDGLYGTRLGWHLPGFQPKSAAWSVGSPSQGLNHSGINWYISQFHLAIDADLDVPLGIEFDSPAGTEASVQLYVNGYQCEFATTF